MRKLLLWSVAIGVSLAATGAQASVVVVKSLGPSARAYPPGKTLPESAKISLQGGDVVTVIGPSSAQTLRGPGSFDARQVALSAAASQRGRFGSLRAAEIAQNPGIWDIDASANGKICVANTPKLQVWRADVEAPMTVQIRSADGQAQELSWAAGTALTPWPSALPIKDGTQYSIEWPDGGESSNLQLVNVGAPPPDLVGAAQVLLQNGCQKQLDLLVESASKSAK
jgi:hypothetical protein